MFLEIDYKEISEFYWNIYFKITGIVSDYRWGDNVPYHPSQEVVDKYESESVNISGWLERGTWRLGDLDDMIHHSDEPMFFYYAMNCLSSMRHRLEDYFNDTSWDYPVELLEEYKRYDGIVMDYYQPIRLGKGEFRSLCDEKEYWWKYYYDLHHRESSYTWVKRDISEVYRELDWLRRYVYDAESRKCFDYSVSSIHDKMESLMVEIYRLRRTVEKDLDE